MTKADCDLYDVLLFFICNQRGGNAMHKITKVDALAGYRLRLRFADGTTGEVDLCSDAGRSVSCLTV